jgi:hypothetical protein
MTQFFIGVCIYSVTHLIDEIYDGIGPGSQHKVIHLTTIHGFYGIYLKNGLSCGYKGPPHLKCEFFARGKRIPVFRSIGYGGKGKSGQERRQN